MGYVEFGNKENLKRIEEITNTNFKILYEKLVSANDIESIIEDLIFAYDKKCEENEKIIQDRDDNFRRLTPEEQYF